MVVDSLQLELLEVTKLDELIPGVGEGKEQDFLKNLVCVGDCPMGQNYSWIEGINVAVLLCSRVTNTNNIELYISK